MVKVWKDRGAMIGYHGHDVGNFGMTCMEKGIRIQNKHIDDVNGGKEYRF